MFAIYIHDEPTFSTGYRDGGKLLFAVSIAEKERSWEDYQ